MRENYLACMMQGSVLSASKALYKKHQSWNRSVPCVVQTEQEMLIMPDDHEYWLCCLQNNSKEMEYVSAPNSVTLSGLWI